MPELLSNLFAVDYVCTSEKDKMNQRFSVNLQHSIKLIIQNEKGKKLTYEKTCKNKENIEVISQIYCREIKKY